MSEATVEHPIYDRVAQRDGKATQLYMITVDEGWRQSIMCVDMYDWAADWLLSVLKDRPKYAPDTRTNSSLKEVT